MLIEFMQSMIPYVPFIVPIGFIGIGCLYRDIGNKLNIIAIGFISMAVVLYSITV